MSALKSLAHIVFGEYALYEIYALSLNHADPAKKVERDLVLAPILDPAELATAPAEEVRQLARYAGPDAACFAAWKQGRMAAACWFWFGETYKQRNFWPLDEGEAKLVQITVDQEFRGQGIARQLLRYAADVMRQRDFKQLFARIWHSNLASIKAFEAAGWRNVAIVAELHPVWTSKPLRLKWTKPAFRKPR